MRHALRVTSYLLLTITLVWTLLALGSGKIGVLFGTEVFIASANDIKIALLTNILGLLALLVLGLLGWMARRQH